MSLLEQFKAATEKFRGMSGLSLAQSQEVDRLYNHISGLLSPENSKEARMLIKELKYNPTMARIADNFVKRALEAEHAGSTDLMRLAHVELMRRYAEEVIALNQLVHVGNLDQYWEAFDQMTDAVRNAR